MCVELDGNELSRSSFGYSTIYSLASFLLLRVGCLVGCGGLRMSRKLVEPFGRIKKYLVGKFSQTGFVNHTTTTLTHRARLGPRVSPRGQTLAEPYTPRLGISVGASGLRVLDGPDRASAKKLREARTSSNGTRASKRQISPYTQPTTLFTSGFSLLMRI